MKMTFRSGFSRRSASASAGPFIPGIITSVTRRSNGAPRVGRESAGVVAAARRDHRVALPLQRPSPQRAHGLVIVYQQHGLDANRGRRRRHGRGSGRGYRLLGARQVDAERRSFARCALDDDVAAALADDSVDHREAETGATFQ